MTEEKNKSKPSIIWVYSSIENIKSYQDYLKGKFSDNIKFYKNIDEAINQVKNYEFEKLIIILSGKTYIKFIEEFKNNLLNLKIIPKFVIFEKNKENFIEKNKANKNIIEHPFYDFGGIKTNIEELDLFLSNLTSSNKFYSYKESYKDLTFDYIDSKEKLALPMYFKALIEITQADKIEQFIEYICENYKKQGLDDILNLIRNMTKIPIQLLSKYLVRIYTAETNFYRDMNKDLRKDNKDDKEKYLPYIKVLYEGVRLKALPLNSEKVLYRGSLFQIKEIQKIKETINKKIQNLPGVILFSKQFLSFSKKQNIAEEFIKENSTDEKLTKVMFTLEYDDKYKLDYNLSTHSDTNQFSFIKVEEEVLFFPFSSFKVEKIEENKEKNRYEIKLLYLGKYLKELEEDKNIQKNNNKLPQTEFTNEIKKYLIQPQVIDNITLKGLYKQFEIYKDSIGKEKEPISITIEKNYIKGEIIIGPDDINKKIKIISSFEQSKRENDQLKEKNPTEYNNEKEIKENCEIKINGISILFAYEYEFKETGTYKIEYVFKKSLTNSCFMFYDCNKLTNLDFSNFDSKNIKNMESMFKKCSSLEQLNLSKFNTENVTIMSNMFNNCDSLKNLNLSDFNTKNVTKMDFMFNCCSKLTDLNLSNFNTEKVTNMEYMFFDCNSLINLNVSKFNTQKVTNMEYMFNGCNSLKKLNLSSFETKSAIDMCSMFDDCSSLENLDISKFTTQENTDIDSMFSSCDSLKIENLNAKDRKILNEFKDK